MNHIPRFTALLCLHFFTLGCDVDDGAPDRDAPEVSDDELSDLEAIDDERDAPDAADEVTLAGDRGRHCVVEATVVPEGVDPADVRAAPSEMKCFSTFAAAIFSVTGERLADDATPDTYEPSATLTHDGPTPRAAKYVSGVEYQYGGYGGKSLTVSGSASCLTASALVLNHFGDLWWDDRISSARAYSGCKHSYHYEHVNQGGAVRDCGSYCDHVGDALQNRTSSLRWTK